MNKNIDSIGNIHFSKPLSVKEIQFFQCYLRTNHYCRSEPYEGLYFANVDLNHYAKTGEFIYQEHIENILDPNNSLDCPSFDNPLHLDNKHLVIADDYDYYDKDELCILVSMLSFLQKHFFSLEPICKKLLPDFFEFIEPRTFYGKVYIKIKNEPAGLFFINISEEGIQLLECTYQYLLPDLEKKPQKNEKYKNKTTLFSYSQCMTLLDSLDVDSELSKVFYAQLKKQHGHITALDIKKNGTFSEENQIIGQYNPCEEILKGIQAYELNQKLKKNLKKSSTHQKEIVKKI